MFIGFYFYKIKVGVLVIQIFIKLEIHIYTSQSLKRPYTQQDNNLGIGFFKWPLDIRSMAVNAKSYKPVNLEIEIIEIPDELVQLDILLNYDAIFIFLTNINIVCVRF